MGRFRSFARSSAWALSAIVWSAACAPAEGTLDSTAPDSAQNDVPNVATDTGFDTGNPIIIPRGCDDVDEDGFGQNCPLGPDCNDNDRTVTNQCYRCAMPATGCACDTDGARRPCDMTTDSDNPGPTGVCHYGERQCISGQWSRCTTSTSTRIVQAPVQCGSNCNPDCRAATTCPSTMGEVTAGGGLVLGNQTLPAFCPGGGTGGVLLPPGVLVPGQGNCTVATSCGGVCCAQTQSCWTQASAAPPGTCSPAGTTPPAAKACGTICGAGTTQCGFPPAESCCTSAQVCQGGKCVATSTTCTSNANCTSPNVCVGGRCMPNPGGTCTGCEGNTNMQSCQAAVRTAGGTVIDDIFRTPNGLDARALRFARYVRGMDFTSLATCPYGRSNASTTAPYTCSTCSPTNCANLQCFTGQRDIATISEFTDSLDWKWIRPGRLDSSNAVVSDNSTGNYEPTRGVVFDLGAGASQVAVFPTSTRAATDCLESIEYTVWLTDNPDATQIASTNTPDPTKWNPTKLSKVFTQGWTRNPNSVGETYDLSDLSSTAFGDARADGAATIWSVPCGRTFRYASIVPGNSGNPAAACTANRNRVQVDAVAGLNPDGNPLSLFFVLPPGGTAGPTSLPVSTTLRSVDAYILIDTTGSMVEERNNLIGSLTSGSLVTGCSGGLVGGIRCIVPDAFVGVGRFEEYPVDPYGYAGTNITYEHSVDMTDNAASVGTALQNYVNHGNISWPESDTAALWSMATGQGIPGFVPARATACPAGRFGYPCFRRGAIPVVLLITDATFQNGPLNAFPYDDCNLFGGCGNIPAWPSSTTIANTNDTTATARTLSITNPVYVRGDNSALANNFNSACGSTGGRDAAFTFTLTARSFVHLDTAASAFDTVLSITRTDLTEVICNDDVMNTDTRSQIDTALDPGTYYVWVDGYSGGSTGGYRLRFDVRASLPNATSPTFSQAVDALNAIGARVITINSGDADQHAVPLANATRSVIAGNPAVYNISADGTGVSNTIITAISDLANYSRMDVTAIAEDNPATAFDERLFVAPVAGLPLGTIRLAQPALGEGDPYPTGRCTGVASSGGGVPYIAQQCLPGTAVNFRALFQNNLIQPTAVQQVFTFEIVTYGNGSYELGRVPVTIVIPPAAYPATGTQTYEVNLTPTDLTNLCGSGRLIRWSQMLVDADTPAGTSIDVDVRTAATMGTLGAATSVRVGTLPPAVSPLEVGNALDVARVATSLPSIRFTFTLKSSPMRDRTPVLRGYRIMFDCIDGT